MGQRSGTSTRWVVAVAGVCAAGFAALAVGLVVQMVSYGGPTGGAHGPWMYPGTNPIWRHALISHDMVLVVSRAGDTVAPMVLVALGVLLSALRRRWLPLVATAATLGFLFVVITAGKGHLEVIPWTSGLHSSSLSGPATTAAATAALAAWMLAGDLGARTALWALAATFTLAVASTQLYVGHRVGQVLVSLLCGALIFGVVSLVGNRCRGRHGADAPPSSRV